jgi:hypothetical protein
MSDFRYEIKTPLPVIWLEILTQIWVGSYVTNTNNDQLILVDPVEDEELKRFVHGLILQTSYNAWSKENGRILTLIRSTLLSIITFYIGYGNILIYSNIFNVITD